MRPIALATALLVLVSAGNRAAADVAATGTFDLDVSSGASVSLDGSLSFTPGTQTALGQDVDLATNAGDMTLSGTTTVGAQQQDATFELAADADATDFAFTASGSQRCAIAGCLSGQVSFTGELLVSAGTALPSGGVYTFDGSIDLDAQGSGVGGAFAINAFSATTTVVGTDRFAGSGAQSFFDGILKKVRKFSGGLAKFASVTGEGDTALVVFSTLPGALPAGIVLDPAVSVFVRIVTKAAVANDVRMCLNFDDEDTNGIVDGSTVAVSDLRLLHAPSLGAAFVDVNGAIEGTSLCAQVTSLGPFVLGVVAPLVPTTTTSSTTLAPGASTTTSTTAAPGGGTTSTTLPAAICATALECLDVAIAGPLCPGEMLNGKLATLILKRLTRAQAQLLKARSTTSAKKTAKLLAKARKQLATIDAKAGAFVSKARDPISADCRDRIRAATGRVMQQIAANSI